MQMERLLQLTADGSYTLYIPEMDEHYHSVNGAIQESEHIFIGAGLRAMEKPDIRILEIGFGTGLNALLTYGSGPNGKSSLTPYTGQNGTNRSICPNASRCIRLKAIATPALCRGLST